VPFGCRRASGASASCWVPASRSACGSSSRSAISWLLAIPLLGAIGGVLLFWIAIKLAVGEDEDADHVSESETLWQAVRTIAIADAVMSLDNVVAIAAVADGNVPLFVFGLVVSIPLIIFGSTLIMGLISRYPIFVWAGADCSAGSAEK